MFVFLSQPAFSEEVKAILLKVKGTVTADSATGTSKPLTTGSAVEKGERVSVSRFSIAVYKIGDGIMVTQQPQASLGYTRLERTYKEKGSAWGVDYLLNRGDTYCVVKPREDDTIDYHVMTSRIEAIAHDAVFKVTHSFSTSTVAVREGTVEVLYCRNTKRTTVHAGEIFEVTDCEGVLRWFNEDEGASDVALRINNRGRIEYQFRDRLCFDLILPSASSPRTERPDDSSGYQSVAPRLIDGGLNRIQRD